MIKEEFDISEVRSKTHMKTQKLVTCTSLYTSTGSGNLRNDVHALLNLLFILLAILVDESWKKKT